MAKNKLKKLGGSHLPSWLGNSSGTYSGYAYDHGQYGQWYSRTLFRLDSKLTDDEMLEQVKEFVDYWYSWDCRIMRIPHITSGEFPAFVGQCIGLSVGVVNDSLTQEGKGVGSITSINLANAPTASYDPKGDSILLPIWAIDPDEMSKQYGEKANLVSIATINGFVSHEFLHAQHSNADLFYSTISTAAMSNNKYGKFLVAAYQLLEDFRIEKKAKFSTKSFLHAVKLVFLPRSEFEQRRQAMIANPKSLEAGIGYGCFLKREDFLEIEDKEKLLPAKARACIHKAERLLPSETGASRIDKLAEEFCQAFDPPKRTSETDVKCTRSECEHSGGDCEVGINVVFDGDKIHNNMADKVVTVTEFNQSVSRALNSVRKVLKISSAYGGSVSIPEPKTFDVLDPEMMDDRYARRYDDDGENAYDDMKRDNLYVTRDDDFVNSIVVGENYRFVRLLNAIRAVNNTPGQALVRGPRLINTRLTRLVTDGKAFGFLDHEQDKSYRVEIVVLMDRSGSQHGAETDYRAKKSNKPVDLLLLQPVIGYRIAEALKQARIPHVVLAHTSCGTTALGESSDTPLVIKISSRGMATSDTRGETARYNRLAIVPPGNNYDGVAITCATKYFTGRNCRKVLIVTSDGWPNGDHGYNGITAESHTRKAIAKARQQGISVYYLSLVKDVKYRNNSLVGEKYNLDATNDLEGQFKKLIAEVSNISGK